MDGVSISTHAKFHLKGLTCAHCAAKIEQSVQEFPGVSCAALNFIDGILEVTPDDGFTMEASAIQSLVDAIEDGIIVEAISEDDIAEQSLSHHKDEDTPRSLLIRIAAGLVFLTLGIFSKGNPAEVPFYLIAYAIGAYPLLINAFKNLKNKNIFDENFLMVVATLGAFAIKEYHEAIGVMIFFQVGELFQEYAVDNSRKSIKSLINMRPESVNLKKNGETLKVKPEEVNPGDIFIVKPGERIPLDGNIIEGVSSLDVSGLTGESIPRDVAPGNEILSGSININGLLTVRAAKTFKESTVSKILKLIETSSLKKAKTEQFITKFARYYTPSVVIFAVILAIIPPLALNQAFSEWFRRALIFLVISCPCALVISIPLGFFGGIGGASKKGILIKGANHLEALNNLKTVLFDKTGTITKGAFKVVSIEHETGDENVLLKYAALAESHSNHPIAKAIVKAYNGPIDEKLIKSYEEIPGIGIKAVIEGENVFAGHDKFLHDENIQHRVCIGAGTTVHVVVNKQYSGYIVIADELKDDSARTMRDLAELGVKTVMLTGDNEGTAKHIAESVNVGAFHAELLPHEKVEKLEYYKSLNKDGGLTAFIGDGINDAPVIARADIGIAMGGLGSDAAIEAADIVFMDDKPSKIVEAINIAKKTRTIVFQNIVFALGVKGVFLTLGATGHANMWEAVFADVGVAIIAIFNSMRTMR